MDPGWDTGVLLMVAPIVGPSAKESCLPPGAKSLGRCVLEYNTSYVSRSRLCGKRQAQA